MAYALPFVVVVDSHATAYCYCSQVTGRKADLEVVALMREASVMYNFDFARARCGSTEAVLRTRNGLLINELHFSGLNSTHYGALKPKDGLTKHLERASDGSLVERTETISLHRNGLALAAIKRALLSAVVASVKVPVTPALHNQALTSSVGVVYAGTASKKQLMFDLTTSITTFMALVVQSSDHTPASLIDLFENKIVPSVNSLMAQGHSPASALESLHANASWVPGEVEVRATTTRTATPSIVPAGPGTGAEPVSRAEYKKLSGEHKQTLKLLADQAAHI